MLRKEVRVALESCHIDSTAQGQLGSEHLSLNSDKHSVSLELATYVSMQARIPWKQDEEHMQHSALKYIRIYIHSLKGP